MNLQERILLLAKLGNYLKNNDRDWLQARLLAEQKNAWFTQEFIQHAAEALSHHFLQQDKMLAWADYYKIDDPIQPRVVGMVWRAIFLWWGFMIFYVLLSLVINRL